MPSFIINELNQNDVSNKSVLTLDAQSYPSNLIWSEKFWGAVLERSIVKLAIRLKDKLDTMFGNIAIIIDSDQIDNYLTYSFKIYTLTIDKDYQGRGWATRLLTKSAELLEKIQVEGKYTYITSISLIVEKDNVAALALYKKCGFSICKVNDRDYVMTQSVQQFCATMKLLSAPKSIIRHKIRSYLMS